MVLSQEQKAWTVIWYGISGSPKKVQIDFRKKFGRNSTAPTNAMIYRLWENFFESNDLNRNKKTQLKWVRTELKIEEVLARFNEDPHLSTRGLAREEGMPSCTTIRRILKVFFSLLCVGNLFSF